MCKVAALFTCLMKQEMPAGSIQRAYKPKNHEWYLTHEESEHHHYKNKFLSSRFIIRLNQEGDKRIKLKCIQIGKRMKGIRRRWW